MQPDMGTGELPWQDTKLFGKKSLRRAAQGAPCRHSHQQRQPKVSLKAGGEGEEELHQRDGGGASRNHGRNEGGSLSERNYLGCVVRTRLRGCWTGNLSPAGKLLRWQAGMWPQASQLLNHMQE